MQPPVTPERCRNLVPLELELRLPFAGLTALDEQSDVNSDPMLLFGWHLRGCFLSQRIYGGPYEIAYTEVPLIQVLAQGCLINLQHDCSCSKHSLIGK